MPPRLILWLCAVVLLFVAGPPALGAEPRRSVGLPGKSAGAPAEWKAVLVAGDNAEPVFDNAVAAVARWLAERGVPTHGIHRLNASPPPSDPSIMPASAERILDRIASLRPRPDERCFVFITSHGQRGEGIWLAYSGEFLRPAALAQALSAGCAGAPTVVIVSGCFSGAFTAARAPNRIIITASRADRPSFGCQADRTYTVFDECLLAALPRASTWRSAYDASLGCVRRRERQMQVVPSQPQGFFGAAVRKLPVR